MSKSNWNADLGYFFSHLFAVSATTIILFLGLSFVAGVIIFSSLDLDDPDYGPLPSVRAESCRDCHTEQFEQWSGSHHALAEQVLEPGAVTVRDVGPDGEMQDFAAVRSIGVAPLVQYVVNFNSRWHVPQQAQDSRDGTWFNVFNDGRQPGEWGHWTGRGMNWDTMCVDCHNTGVRRAWEGVRDTFDTTVREHGVACTACHDFAWDHVDDSDTPITRSDSEQCWPCHARRSQISFANPSTNFLDGYFPGLPDFTETWHVDGQIQDEDFEYTSFALSKMHAAGVTCLDCHDPHTAKLRAEGNGLCMTCHSGGGRVPAPVIDTATHSGHDANTAGSDCTSCHMSTTVYMQRHPRHDHGFLIPDPQLSIETGVPNACTKCHSDRSNEWAAKIVEARPTWKGNKAIRQRARAMYAARQEQSDALPQLISALHAETQVTWRATLLNMLKNWPEDPQAQQLRIDAGSSEHALERAMAWPLPKLLEDPVRAVRLNAALALPQELVDPSRASRDIRANLKINRGQPAGAMAEAQYELAHGRGLEAYRLAKRAERWEKTSPAPLHMQATAFDSIGRTTEAYEIMQECCKRFPEDATSWYLLGLAAAAEQDYAACKQALQTALKLQPDFPAAARNLQAIVDFENP